MINYSIYCFLDGAQRDISDLDEQTILYTRDNIEKYKPTKILDIDIPVFLISTIILHNLKNNFLTQKFVTNYSKLFESHFSTDIHDKEVRKAVLYHLNVLKDIQFFKLKDQEFTKIHMMDYLEILESILAPEQFKLTNQTLSKGYVYLETNRFVYLCRLVIEKMLFDKIKNMKDYNDEIINEIVKELDGRYPVEQKRVFNKTVPESIQSLINKAYSLHELTHRERLKLGVYLQGQNYEWDYIIEIFKQLSNFDLKITTSQLQSLKRYIKSE